MCKCFSVANPMFILGLFNCWQGLVTCGKAIAEQDSDSHFFFPLRNWRVKKIKLAKRSSTFITAWQRCMSHTGTAHMKVIIICHAKYIPLKISQNHTVLKISKIVSCSLSRTPIRYVTVNWNHTEMGKFHSQRHFALTCSPDLKQKYHYFQAVSHDNCPELSI